MQEKTNTQNTQKKNSHGISGPKPLQREQITQPHPHPQRQRNEVSIGDEKNGS
jgi:hypothetical protein